MRHSIAIVLLGTVFTVAAFAANEVEEQPIKSRAWGLESGVLWEVGTGTPFAYRMLQTQLSWRSGEIMGFGFTNGARLVVRNRFTLLGTVVQGGPESHYIALSASPSLELSDRTGTWTLFGGAGGGGGGLDSRGIKGGQGQDFTLNWFARGGIEHRMARNFQVSAAIMFQHMSNGGQTKPNPGIDALGFMLGCAWSR